MIIQDVSIDADSKKEVSVFWYESEYAIRNSKIRKKYSKMKKKKKKCISVYVSTNYFSWYWFYKFAFNVNP